MTDQDTERHTRCSEDSQDILARLTARLEDRKTAQAADSYVAQLYGKGRSKIAEKLGEEAVELVIAAVSQSDNAVIAEAADVLFHMMVLLAERDLSIADVLAVLAQREGLSGLDEKAARQPSATERNRS